MTTNAFYPQRALINAITNAQNAQVTFTEDHDFTIGEIVSFRVEKNFGMFEINQKRAKVLSITSDTITVDIDSSSWTAFDYSMLNSDGTTPPHCVPSSSSLVPNANPPRINILDAFDNRRA